MFFYTRSSILRTSIKPSVYIYMFNFAFVRFYGMKRSSSRRRQASLGENRAKRPYGVIVHASPSVSVMRIHRLPISGSMSIDRKPPAEHGRPIVLVNDNLERTYHLGSENSLGSWRSSPDFTVELRLLRE